MWGFLFSYFLFSCRFLVLNQSLPIFWLPALWLFVAANFVDVFTVVAVVLFVSLGCLVHCFIRDEQGMMELVWNRHVLDRHWDRLCPHGSQICLMVVYYWRFSRNAYELFLRHHSNLIVKPMPLPKNLAATIISYHLVRTFCFALYSRSADPTDSLKNP